MIAAKRIRLTHRYCPHCQKERNIKTYKEHKRLFFNPDTRSWYVASRFEQETTENDLEGLSSLLANEKMEDHDSSFESESESVESSPFEDDYDDSKRFSESEEHCNAPMLEETEEDFGSFPHDTGVETEYWCEDDSEIVQDFNSHQSPSSLPSTVIPPSVPEKGCDDSKPLVWWIVFFVSVFQTLHCISDQAIDWLLKFIHILLQFLACYSPRLQGAAATFPKSLHLRDKLVKECTYVTLVEKYVSCSTCHSLYNFNDCFEKRGTQLVTKTCSNVRHSRKCNTALVKQVVSRSGSPMVYPIKTYSYCSLVSTLQRFFLRPGFVDLCEGTRTLCTTGSNLMSDVYQGRVWKEFLKVGQSHFLSTALCYGLMLNIDWFRPYDHFTYSLGVVYLAVMNLPRAHRYKRQNIIKVGIIPGPSEPPLSVNSYLSPLVTELQQLWKGVQFKIYNSSQKVVRAALLLVACDMPASRKVCGFLSHSANLGCHRCYCEFSEGSLRRNYSNFERTSWSFRDNSKHRSDVCRLLQCSSKSALSRMESELGCRYSVLLELSYFNPIQMTIIDPMHNLFLGSAKHITMDVLLGEGLLTKPSIGTVHKRIKSVQVPIDMGRLPSRLDSGSTFTAEQWMTWTLYFSIYCFHGLLNPEQMECWRAFVLACRRLCKTCISEEDIKVADLLLTQFCKRVKRVFGVEFVTPNMHMHLHLADCVRDFGPLHSFWLFSFERCNGLLGKQPTNNRSIELQLMKRFLRDNTHLDLLNTSGSTPLAEHFSDIIYGHAKTLQSSTDTGTNSSEQVLELPTKYTLHVLESHELELLRESYAYIYPERASVLLDENNQIPTTCKRYNHIQFSSMKLSSACGSYQGKVPYALAHPVTQTQQHQQPNDPRPIKILYFIQHSWIVSIPHEVKAQHFSHTFAVCQWPQQHPDRHVMGKPVEVWCRDIFDARINCFVPIENVVCHVIVAVECLNEENVLVVIPFVH